MHQDFPFLAHKNIFASQTRKKLQDRKVEIHADFSTPGIFSLVLSGWRMVTIHQSHFKVLLERLTNHPQGLLETPQVLYGLVEVPQTLMGLCESF